jgi:hypothetical protein
LPDSTAVRALATHGVNAAAIPHNSSCRLLHVFSLNFSVFEGEVYLHVGSVCNLHTDK